MIPAATADPITPATFGPMACIRRMFCGFASRPTLFATLAAMGTAETPAAPINGLMGVLDNLFSNLPIRSRENAQGFPIKELLRAEFRTNSQSKKNGHNIDQGILGRVRKPINDAALAHQVAETHSRIRLPKHSMPSNGAADGSNRATSNNSINGKIMRSAFDTSRNCTISI